MIIEDILKTAQNIVPKLSPSLHKGSNGRIGVFGGSVENSGAPYFAAMSALKVGADLVFVFCCSQAAPIIKGYCPELIVYPVLDSKNAITMITPALEKLHGVVIGPGLGKDPAVLDTIKAVIGVCKERNLPMVLDADGIYLLTMSLDLIQGYHAPVLLTPNKMEFKRLACPLGLQKTQILEVAKHFKCIIIVKGQVDVIANGRDDFGGSAICDDLGTFRRCGGQGDMLAGVAGVFLVWQKMQSCNGENMGYGVSAFAAATLIRCCSFLAYSKYKRSMTASNILEFIQESFENLFELEEYLTKPQKKSRKSSKSQRSSLRGPRRSSLRNSHSLPESQEIGKPEKAKKKTSSLSDGYRPSLQLPKMGRKSRSLDDPKQGPKKKSPRTSFQIDRDSISEPDLDIQEEIIVKRKKKRSYFRTSQGEEFPEERRSTENDSRRKSSKS